MKRIILPFAFITMMLFPLGIWAQENNPKKDIPLYLSVESKLFSDRCREKDSPFSLSLDYAAKLGINIKQKTKIYAVCESSYVINDNRSSSSYYAQGSLGIGAAYTIYPRSRNYFFEPDLSVTSTIFKTGPGYLNTQLAVKFGLNVCRFKPYIGLCAGHMFHYDKTLHDKFLLGFTFGIVLW